MIPVQSIGGSNQLGVFRDGTFQEVGRRNVAGDGSAFFNLMSLVANDPANATYSYDYYIDT